MASVFDRIEDKVEYITWEDVVHEGFVDSQTISPWFAYRVEMKASMLGLRGIDAIYCEMAKFFPERKANPYIGPIQDEPSKLYYKAELGDHEYKMIINPTIEDLNMAMAIIRQVTILSTSSKK